METLGVQLLRHILAVPSDVTCAGCVGLVLQDGCSQSLQALNRMVFAADSSVLELLSVKRHRRESRVGLGASLRTLGSRDDTMIQLVLGPHPIPKPKDVRDHSRELHPRGFPFTIDDMSSLR